MSTGVGCVVPGVVCASKFLFLIGYGRPIPDFYPHEMLIFVTSRDTFVAVRRWRRFSFFDLDFFWEFVLFNSSTAVGEDLPVAAPKTYQINY